MRKVYIAFLFDFW